MEAAILLLFLTVLNDVEKPQEPVLENTLVLQEGLNPYEVEAVLGSKLLDGEIFEFYLQQRYAGKFGGKIKENEDGSEVRTNFDYSAKFLATSIDLDGDGVLEVITEVDAPYTCSIYCILYILKFTTVENMEDGTLEDRWKTIDYFDGVNRYHEFYKKYNYTLVRPKGM